MNKYAILDKNNRLLNSYRPFDKNTWALIQSKLLLDWTYNSNAIEGNTLTYKETSFYLLQGLTAKDKSLEEHLSVSNHKDAVLYLEKIVYDKKLVLTEKLIRELHQILFKNIDKIKIGPPGHEFYIDIKGGSYKKINNHVMKTDGSIHYYVEALSVSAEMKKLIDWYNKNKNKFHAIDLAAHVHYELVRIHPFTDGNGRVSRLLMNLILMNRTFPPAIIKYERRKDYYSALEKGDGGDLRPFTKIIQGEVLNTIKLILDIISGKKQQSSHKHVIYKLRMDKKLGQVELSRLSGIGQAMLSRIENLKEKPNMRTAKKLAKIFIVDVLKIKENEE